MIPVSVIWVTSGGDGLERHLPLIWGGERIRRLGVENGLHLVFIEGLTRLTSEYRRNLQELGYILHDAAPIWDRLSYNYKTLDRFGSYEKRCFLRWLLFEELFAGEPIVHFDADVVFNIAPSQIASACRGLSFVLHGCPAFTVLGGDRDWLAAYKRELNEFSKDIMNYSQLAWGERDGWEQSGQEKWAGCRFRKIISSDQDLISHLIHTDRLPQDSPELVKSKIPYFLLNDPLYFFGLMPEKLPITYKRCGLVDHFDGQVVAFWHMQSDFVRYLSFCSARACLGQRGRCVNPLETKSLETFLWRAWLVFRGRLDRRQVYRRYFEYGDFSRVFSADGYWKEGVFV